MNGDLAPFLKEVQKLENASSDRRKHKRYTVPDDAISVCNTKIGRVLNISEGGMAVNFITAEPFSEGNMVTIICGTKSLLIQNLPIRLVRKNDKPFSFMSTFQIQTVGIKFNYSNTAQHDQIKQYISGLSSS
jgi:hypothetical protein